MKTLLLFFLLTVRVVSADYVIGVSAPANNEHKVPLTIKSAPFPVVDFSLVDDYLNPDLRDYMGRDDKGRVIAPARGPVPSFFPALIDCESGAVVPWTTKIAATNALAMAVAATEFGKARQKLDAVRSGRDDAQARADLLAALDQAKTVAELKRATLDLADFLFATEQASEKSFAARSRRPTK